MSGTVRPAAPADRSTRREGGYILVMMGLLMLPLMAVVGFATDVGSWYVQGSKLQRAADAAALAGVVWMPDLDAAEDAARTAVEKNGFDLSGDRFEVEVTRVGPARLQVVILDTNADLFFSSLVLDEMQIQRAAVAEYLKPLPLGSPLNSFGQDLSCALASCRPNFWAAIQAPFTKKAHGDPYATSCIEIDAPGTSCSTVNPEYRPAGYWYQVEVSQSLIDFFGGAVPVNIEIYDAGFYNRPNPFTETGDFAIDGSTTQPGFQVEVYRNDNTPLDHTDNPSWSGGACRRTIAAGTDTATYRNTWHRVCRIIVTEPVFFPVNVRTSDLAGGVAATGSATANYSLRVRAECGATICPPGVQPRLYGLGDFSIFLNPGGGSTSEFFVAEVNEQARGKELAIELYDPGDGSSGNYFMSMIDPRTNSPYTSCTWSSTNGTSGTASPCRLQTSNSGVSLFNGQWLSFRIPIPTDYACTPPAGTGCWWKVRYEFPGASTPSDRITVRVSVRGDPIKLVR